MFETWRLESLPFENILVKLKEYARSKRLDGDATKGKQAIDLSRVQNWADEKVVEEDGGGDENDDGTLNPLNNNTCYSAKRKGTISLNAANS